jgi:hypothetical protein
MGYEDTQGFWVPSDTQLPPQNITGLLPVNVLGTPGASHVVAVSSGSTPVSVTLGAETRRVSVLSTQGVWYSLSGPATNTSHYIEPLGVRDFNVPPGTTLSFLAENLNTSVRISELQL